MRKINIFWGMLLWGHHKIGLYLGVISMHFLGSFLKVKVQNFLKSMSQRMHFKPF